MNFEQYQQSTEETWKPEDLTIDPADAELVAAAFGMWGERGELLDMIKKQVFHGVPADRAKVLKECGDVLFYTTRMAAYFNFTLEEVAQANHDKLAARYPNGFVKGGGIR